MIHAAVLTISNDVLALRHEFHVKFYEILILGQFKLIHFDLLLLQHNDKHEQLLEFGKLLNLGLEQFGLIRRQISPKHLSNSHGIANLILGRNNIPNFLLKLYHISITHNDSRIDGEEVPKSVLVDATEDYLGFLVELAFGEVLALVDLLGEALLEDVAVTVEPFVELGGEGKLGLEGFVELVVELDLIHWVLFVNVVEG